jgi:hypothetical protein
MLPVFVPQTPFEFPKFLKFFIKLFFQLFLPLLNIFFYCFIIFCEFLFFLNKIFKCFNIVLFLQFFFNWECIWFSTIELFFTFHCILQILPISLIILIESILDLNKLIICILYFLLKCLFFSMHFFLNLIFVTNILLMNPLLIWFLTLP